MTIPKSSIQPEANAVKPKRRRRNGEDVRRLIVEAAFELFEERGYAGATTRDIADRAGANEVLLFRYFGSKAGLFRHAVVQPLSEFIQEYAATIEVEGSDRVHLSRVYAARLYDMLKRHKNLFMALITASYYDQDSIPGLRRMPEMQNYFAAAAQTVQSNSETLNMDIDLAVRLPFGLVMSMVLFSDWLFDGPREFGREELIEAAARMMFEGVIGKPPEGPP